MFLRGAFLFLMGVFLISCNSEEKSESSEGFKNRLSKASNPYLKGHADNPVDWYEWGEEALRRAREENKPIVVSVGYSACHWCHVMEEESFMDTAVAAVMNKNFISIKVDREERPDIDKIYMDAAQLLNGSGGWPLNVIALPDGRPFFAGTYFPKDQWIKLLKQVAQTYNEDKEELVRTADALAKGIREGNSLDSLQSDSSELSSKENYLNLIQPWKEEFDTYRGGYKSEQKFPLPVSWDALLQYYYLTGDQEVLEFVEATLGNMGEGGIYDHLGGGFARYTTDSKWLVPHFEKMLYDNAQLISLYARAYKLTGKKEYASIIRESLDFVERELSNGEGGYYSSINADSDGEEGEYYVWTTQEINDVLSSKEADLILDYYNIESYGNWENGKNILYRNYDLKEYADERALDLSELNNILSRAKQKLFTYRNNRKRPSTDNKIITSWNALMIQAYIDAFTALKDERYLKRAENTAGFLISNLGDPEHGLKRSYMDGEKGKAAFLDDYSYLGNALINLYQINFDKKWLTTAKNITDYAITHFEDDSSGMFFYTSDNADQLITRQFEIDDNVLPSSNSVMALNLFLLGELTMDKKYSERSERMLTKVLNRVKKQPSHYANWTKLWGYKAYGIYEVAILGEKAIEKNILLQSEYFPTALFMGGTAENLPLLEGKLVPGSTLIYVCQNKTCKYPVEEVLEAKNMLNSNQQSFSGFTNW
ncbi:thioredoxin domain-containing protein [Gramella sp. KN1008]|uniref:thioredoxin domain-containing protein n=1 Tax=Gramella sp. KN1008 TaxID=2529298 RepID=UPI00103E49D9|nr:thioredoxin domain-containing protein [Gramella sp. KN1008]TBW27373.1 thioredoxin domain-containing protein [Gramella sp. KN1008]